MSISHKIESKRGQDLRIPRANDAAGSHPESAILLGEAVSPTGGTITVDRISVRLNGSRRLPVMGEFHYSRYSAAEWRDALLRMKHGGIDIVATYVFWIHHEEIAGGYDWSGQRDLREFVRLCGEVGLSIVVRCGPWCHGECRNGGLPDWLLDSEAKTRTNDPDYIARVVSLFSQIAAQLSGHLWKDGGPVIGIQVENEYGGPAEHLLTLKHIAIETGLDVPLYTRTGWPELTTPMPPAEMVPLFGGYPDGFWDRSLAEMPPGFAENFLFRNVRNDASVATDQLGVRTVADEPDNEIYPYFACEIGGGMMTSYHRRIQLAPRDIESLALAKLGSGNNLQGYYMYHGGTNPKGVLSTLQESQATGYWNDLPVRSYDFQAPLGEFGQVRKHYHSLRRMHLFLRDFGEQLAAMPAYLPEVRTTDPADLTTVRWSVRSDGNSGFIFVNNYQRLQPLPRRPDVRFDLALGQGMMNIPETPIAIPADACFIWPFHLDLDGAKLIYATAQLICRVTDGCKTYVVFAETAGNLAEFVFDSETVTVESTNGTKTAGGGKVKIGEITTGTGEAIRLRSRGGYVVSIVLLSDGDSLACWKSELCGRERILLTRAAMIAEGDCVRLQAADPRDLTVAILPAERLDCISNPITPRQDGLFRTFAFGRSVRQLGAPGLELVRMAGPARKIQLGSQGVAEAPGDTDFEQAAVYRIRLPEEMNRECRALLEIDYIGDVARVTLNGELLTDNFYNGTTFEIGLWRYAPDIYSGELLLSILPMPDEAPIYLPADARTAISCQAIEVHPHVRIIEMHETRALFIENT